MIHQDSDSHTSHMFYCIHLFHSGSGTQIFVIVIFAILIFANDSKLAKNAKINPPRKLPTIRYLAALSSLMNTHE